MLGDLQAQEATPERLAPDRGPFGCRRSSLPGSPLSCRCGLAGMAPEPSYDGALHPGSCPGQSSRSGLAPFSGQKGHRLLGVSPNAARADHRCRLAGPAGLLSCFRRFPEGVLLRPWSGTQTHAAVRGHRPVSLVFVELPFHAASSASTVAHSIQYSLRLQRVHTISSHSSQICQRSPGAPQRWQTRREAGTAVRSPGPPGDVGQ